MHDEEINVQCNALEVVEPFSAILVFPSYQASEFAILVLFLTVSVSNVSIPGFSYYLLSRKSITAILPAGSSME